MYKSSAANCVRNGRLVKRGASLDRLVEVLWVETYPELAIVLRAKHEAAHPVGWLEDFPDNAL